MSQNCSWVPSNSFMIREVKPSIMATCVFVTWRDPHRSVRTMEASHATRRHVRQHADTCVRTP